MTTKICSTCGLAKPLDQFHMSKAAKHGRQGNCIDCNRKQATLKNWKNSGLEMDFGKYEDLKQKQNGRCAICGRTPEETGQKKRELAVDHAHESKVIRGLLCMDCNTAIGKLGHDPVRIRNAAEYIEGKR